MFRKKEVKQDEANDPVEKLENPFEIQSVLDCWKAFGEDRIANGAGDAEKLVLSRELLMGEGHDITIRLGSQLELTILEKLEQDFIQHIRKELKNDYINLKKKVEEQKQTQKLYTSKDKYDHMVEQNPALKSLRDKLGLDFEY